LDDFYEIDMKKILEELHQEYQAKYEGYSKLAEAYHILGDEENFLATMKQVSGCLLMLNAYKTRLDALNK